MSDVKRPKTLVNTKGGNPNQVISVHRVGDVVYICEHAYTPAKDPETGDFGSCSESVIGFEIGVISDVIGELEKIAREDCR